MVTQPVFGKCSSFPSPFVFMNSLALIMRDQGSQDLKASVTCKSLSHWNGNENQVSCSPARALSLLFISRYAVCLWLVTLNIEFIIITQLFCTVLLLLLSLVSEAL